MALVRRFLASILVAATLLSWVPSAFAERVRGYYRRNGTYVQPYERTPADGNPYNNYGYPGNYNPNTGSVTGGNQNTYLNNYYGNNQGVFSSPWSWDGSNQ